MVVQQQCAITFVRKRISLSSPISPNLHFLLSYSAKACISDAIKLMKNLAYQTDVAALRHLMTLATAAPPPNMITSTSGVFLAAAHISQGSAAC
jgi:hypothetical protein